MDAFSGHQGEIQLCSRLSGPRLLWDVTESDFTWYVTSGVVIYLFLIIYFITLWQNTIHFNYKINLYNELTTSVLTENRPCRKLSIAIHLRGRATSSSLCLKQSSDGASLSEIPKSEILMTKCESTLLIDVGQFTYYKHTYNYRLLIKASVT